MKPELSGYRQLGLDLGLKPLLDRASYCVSPANAGAIALVEAWPRWPDQCLLLLGPSASGKTHLAHIWAAHSHAVVVEAAKLAQGDWQLLGRHGAVVVEQADAIASDEAHLFHLINLMREQRGWLMLTAHSPPDQWGLTTPDLLSRLRLAPAISIAPPDDALLRNVFRKGFADRQVVVDPGVIDYTVARMERSFSAAQVLIAQLDSEALTRGTAITRNVANAILTQLYGDDDLFDPA